MRRVQSIAATLSEVHRFNRQIALFGGVGLLLTSGLVAGGETNQVSQKPPQGPNIPEMVEADGKLRLTFDEETLVLPRGLQPSLLRTKTGALIVQAQIPEKPLPTKRMVYPYAMETRVSRDNGRTWTVFPRPHNENGVNLEGGVVQLRDGTIFALDTYITPGTKPNEGLGQVYTSTNDWQTLEGPREVRFELPDVDFYASRDDGGHPHEAERLHRRILELPNGDLVTTCYGQLKGDKTPSTYMPSMMKARVMFLRSTDRGQNWALVSTVAVDPAIGTEGFDEPVLARLSQGASAGRLICLMRTGRELREAYSDDGGANWSAPRPRVFAGLDVYRTELWVDHFRNFKGSKGKLLDENNPDELRGAVVDPDLIELRSGILVAAFGVRIPQKACWAHPEHPWNGNYLAFSTDHGQTWSNVVRLTSGKLTTHYMAIEESLEDNKIFVVTISAAGAKECIGMFGDGSWRLGRNNHCSPVKLQIRMPAPESRRGWENDEIRMTNDETNPNIEILKQQRPVGRLLGIWNSGLRRNRLRFATKIRLLTSAATGFLAYHERTR